MPLFHQLSPLTRLLARLVLMVVMGMVLPLVVRGQSSPTVTDLFLGETPFRAISYDLPNGAWPNTLPPLCQLARDLPLIAETGATALYTRGAPPEDGDHIFLSLLASTRLSWVAAYPPPDDIDRTQPLIAQKATLLAQFTAFAERFSGNHNLRGVVLDFGPEHMAESAAMAGEFAAILARHFPLQTPRLGQAAYTPVHLEVAPPSISFWLYRFEDSLPTNITRLQLRQRTLLPVVFDLSNVARQLLPPEGAPPSFIQPSWKDYLALFRGGDAQQPLLTLRFLGQREVAASSTSAASNGATTTTLSFRYRADGLFIGVRDTALLENLQPTLLAKQQREDWDATPLEDHTAPPHVESVRNAATADRLVSPGTQVRVEGERFAPDSEEILTAPDWPLHAGARCLCVAGRPVPLAALGASQALAQLPWLLETGPAELRLVREGVASAPVTINLLDFSPGIFADAVARSGNGIQNGCSVSAASGVKPGETLELRVTGAGPLNGGATGLRVILDGADTQLLSAELVSEEPGIARITVKVPEPALSTGTASSGMAGLYLRRGAHASNLLPISFAGDARPTVGMVASSAALQVQPGGPFSQTRIQTEGLNGYCGLVDFEVLGLPRGVSATISRVQAGEEAILQLRADGSAEPVHLLPFYLYAVPAPGDLRLLTLEVTVLARAASVPVSLESAGFASGASATIRWGGAVLAPTGGEGIRGLYLLTANPVSGVIAPVERFDIFLDAAESNRLETRLSILPAGTIVAMAVADDATLSMQPSLRTLIRIKLGSAAIDGLGFQHSWAIIGTVGAALPLAEATSASQKVNVQATLQFPPM